MKIVSEQAIMACLIQEPQIKIKLPFKYCISQYSLYFDIKNEIGVTVE